MKSPIIAFLLLLSPGLCIAQLDPLGMESECANAAATASAPLLVIQDSVAGQLTEARLCLQSGDSRCADRAIVGLDPESLNDDENGALALLRGDIEAVKNNRRRAQREYQAALELPVVHWQIARGATERLAILNVRAGQYEQALQRLEGLSCGEWSPDLLFLVASAHYSVEQFESSLENVQSAIDSRQAAGGAIPESWFSLRAAAVQRLEGASSDELFCQTETPIDSLIRVERCYTAEELRRQAACETSARAQQSIGYTVDCYPR